MKLNNLKKALEIISTEARHTAPVTIKFGYCDKSGFVNNDELVIIDCPPAITDALVKANFSLSVCQVAGGVVLEDYKL